MGNHRTIFALIAIMTAVALVIGGVAIGVLYDTAFEQNRADLMQTAQSQARLMEAVARGRRLETLQTEFRQRIVDAGQPPP